MTTQNEGELGRSINSINRARTELDFGLKSQMTLPGKKTNLKTNSQKVKLELTISIIRPHAIIFNVTSFSATEIFGVNGQKVSDSKVIVCSIGRNVLVSGEIFFILSILNKKKTENARACRAGVRPHRYARRPPSTF